MVNEDKIIILYCKQCGENFSSYKSNKRKFCSRKCHNKWKSINLQGKLPFYCNNTGKIGEKSPSWKGGLVTKNCKECGIKIKTYLSINKKFCSRECMGKWMSENLRGEDHPLYQNINKKYCEKFNESCRESNREKYNNECFICSKSEIDNGRKLSVHHIDMNKNQGCNDHEWALVPVCMSCHGMIHNDLWESRIKYLINLV